MGTTSAHAENTTDHGLPRRGERNYLRARGEYRPVGQHERSASELPPRTRRIQSVSLAQRALEGTTSAHAENTLIGHCDKLGLGNYLRARGEYRSWVASVAYVGELPPRTRRIRLSAIAISSGLGTTSAHAENTDIFAAITSGERNYLRARGEYPKSAGSFITWFSKMGQI